MSIGPRRTCPDDGVVEQRQLDGHRRPRRIRQVLAVEHEQRENVPGAQGANSRHQVFPHFLFTTHFRGDVRESILLLLNCD